MTEQYTAICYDGNARPAPPAQPLRAGPLTLVLDGVDLRYIRFGDRELLRRVYVAVRDRNWDTVPATLSNVLLDTSADAFTLSFAAAHRDGPIDFTWHGTITGHADGTVTYAMDGEARDTFLKNRIGFCVLHPMACAGQPCTVTKADGAVEQAAFPRFIAPHQPFVDFQAIAHEVAPGVRVEVRLDGDVFESEDQRNWTDASFKTYSTPLRQPYPVEVPRGARIRQSFALALHHGQGAHSPDDAPARVTARDEDVVSFDIDPTAVHALPRLGLGMASHGRPLGEDEVECLRALRLSHLRVDLNLGDLAYRDRLALATREARVLGAQLEAALFLSVDAERELDGLTEAVRAHGPDVVRWLVFHKDEKSTAGRWVRLARQALGHACPGALFGGGTNAYFAELNRSRPPLDALDLVSYSINPQVHAFDNASLVETLAAQAATLESARQFCGALPLAVSPVTLRPRFNPNATGPEPAPAADQLPPQVDPRQLSLLGAGWTAGSLASLARGGAASATYYETTGWRGVLEVEEGSPLPSLFPSSPGMAFPLYHVLADVGELAGAIVVGGVSSDSLRVDGLALRDEGADEDGGRTRILLGNMTGRPVDVRVGPLDAEAMWMRSLDEHSFERATRDSAAFRREPGDRHACAGGSLRLTLLPYAIARIDTALQGA